jgi:hypothetical protein
MPNKTIYLDTINYIEENIGGPFLDREELAQKLQDAWEEDKTTAKVDYLNVYRNIFRNVLKNWSERELSNALYVRSEKMADFKKCLIQTDESLKLCAMALIPELRENADVLSHMTFGVMEPADLKNDFILARGKYLSANESSNALKKRRAESYDKYKNVWQETTTRKITELVRDKNALQLMSEDEKIDYALALDTYRNIPNLARPLDIKEKELIDDALAAWKQEIGIPKTDTLDDFVGNQYFQYTAKLGDNKWIDREINEAVEEFNKSPNPAMQEIKRYKEVEKTTETLSSLREEANEQQPQEMQRTEEEKKQVAYMPATWLLRKSIYMATRAKTPEQKAATKEMLKSIDLIPKGCRLKLNPRVIRFILNTFYR